MIPFYNHINLFDASGIKGLIDPTLEADAVNKRYVDSLFAGVKNRTSALYATKSSLPYSVYTNDTETGNVGQQSQLDGYMNIYDIPATVPIGTTTNSNYGAPIYMVDDNYGFAGGNGKIVNTVDGWNATWTDHYIHDSQFLAFAGNKSTSTIYAISKKNTNLYVHYSTNNGATWTLGKTIASTGSIVSIACGGPNIIITDSTNLIYYSSTGVENLSVVYTGVESIFMGTFSMTNNNVCFAYVGNSGLLYSYDGGLTWNFKTTNKSISILQHVAMYFYDKLTGWMLLSSNGGVAKTTDGGKTWVDITVTYMAEPPKFLHFESRLNGYMIGYYGSIWKTYDGGNTWTQTYSANVDSGMSAKSFKTYCFTGSKLICGINLSSTTMKVVVNYTKGESIIDKLGPLAYNETVLIKNQTDQKQNGIYRKYADLGSDGKMTFFRISDMDQSPEELYSGLYVFIQKGIELAGSGWIQISSNITIGTTNIVFVQMSKTTAYRAGTGININSDVISLDLDFMKTMFGTGLTMSDTGVVSVDRTDANIKPAVKRNFTVNLVADTPYELTHELKNKFVWVTSYDNNELMFLDCTPIDEDKCTLLSLVTINNLEITVFG